MHRELAAGAVGVLTVVFLVLHVVAWTGGSVGIVVFEEFDVLFGSEDFLYLCQIIGSAVFPALLFGAGGLLACFGGVPAAFAVESLELCLLVGGEVEIIERAFCIGAGLAAVGLRTFCGSAVSGLAAVLWTCVLCECGSCESAA